MRVERGRQVQRRIDHDRDPARGEFGRDAPRFRAAIDDDGQLRVVVQPHRLADVRFAVGDDGERHAARDDGLQRLGIEPVEQLVARARHAGDGLKRRASSSALRSRIQEALRDPPAPAADAAADAHEHRNLRPIEQALRRCEPQQRGLAEERRHRRARRDRSPRA